MHLFHRLFHILLYKGKVIPVRHKANVLTVLPSCVYKAVIFCDFPYLRLCQLPKGKQYPGKLGLGEHIEKIALVFCVVLCPKQQIPSGGFVPTDAGIMAGGDHLTAKPFRFL